MTATAATASWFRVYHPVAAPRLRLVCFPHAGAGPTTYRAWANLMPSDVELLAVAYPGRQDRFGEPFATSLDTVADQVAAALAPLTERPYALFGHSMGALIGYEVALRLAAGGQAPPQQLFVSGRWPPGRADPRQLHLADDATLAAEVRQLGSPDAAVLEIPEIRELALEVLRADYRLLAGHYPRSARRLTVPVVAYGGEQDPHCRPPELLAWSGVTGGEFASRIFPGGHFYLAAHRTELVGDILGRLAPAPSHR